MVKSHGLRGEVAVKLVTDRFDRLDPGAVLHGPHGPLEVLASRPHQDGFLVVFAGVVDREDADQLRGAVLSAAAVEDPDALWVHELIGAEVVDVDGKGHGLVVSVEANPASDLLVLDDGALVPLSFLVGTDPGRVVIDPPPGLFDQGP